MRTLRFLCFLTGLVFVLGVAVAGAWLAWTFAHAVTWAGIKSAFYTVIIAAIFFYTACAIRAVAKYFEAKAAAVSRLKSEV